jgi:hypothetical protein
MCSTPSLSSSPVQSSESGTGLAAIPNPFVVPQYLLRDESVPVLPAPPEQLVAPAPTIDALQAYGDESEEDSMEGVEE